MHNFHWKYFAEKDLTFFPPKLFLKCSSIILSALQRFWNTFRCLYFFSRMGNRFGVGHYIKWALSKTMLSVFISEASLFWDVSFKVSVFFLISSISREPYTDSTIPDFFPKCTLTCKQINEPSKNRNFLRIWTSLIRAVFLLAPVSTFCLNRSFPLFACSSGHMFMQSNQVF